MSNKDSIKKIKTVIRKDLEKKYTPTLRLKTEQSIAMDFAEKVYEKFDKLIKSVVLFGSTAKNNQVVGSDIDIIIIVDDAMVKFDDILISWYREELGKIIQANRYNKDLHINTVKLTTWWEDLQRGDPVVINIIRYGEPLIDFAGFFLPFKILLQDGRIRTTREAIYTTLNRVPGHIVNSQLAELGAVEGCYWAMIESAQALLMSINVSPPSPEHVASLIKENFVDKKLMKSKHVSNIKDVYETHKDIIHGKIKNLDGRVIDTHQKNANDFFKVVIKLIGEIVDPENN